MAKNTLIAAGPKLQQKLKELASGVTNVDLTPAQKISNRQEIISRRGTGSGKTSAYNGYFTIKDISTRNEDGTIKEYRVAVCDGETWDEETETSGKSTVRLNFASYYLDCKIVSPAQRYIYVQYNDSTQEINITSTDALLESNVEKGVYYYLIGEFDKITARIIQRHTGIGNGEAQIWVATYSCL